jgi:hypothetical protein
MDDPSPKNTPIQLARIDPASSAVDNIRVVDLARGWLLPRSLPRLNEATRGRYLSPATAMEVTDMLGKRCNIYWAG